MLIIIFYTISQHIIIQINFKFKLYEIVYTNIEYYNYLHSHLVNRITATLFYIVTLDNRV